MIKIQTMLIMILHDFETYKLSYKYKILIKVLALIFCIITPDHRNRVALYLKMWGEYVGSPQNFSPHWQVKVYCRNPGLEIICT